MSATTVLIGGFTFHVVVGVLTVATNDGGSRDFAFDDYADEVALTDALVTYIESCTEGWVEDAIDAVCDDEDWPFGHADDATEVTV